MTVAAASPFASAAPALLALGFSPIPLVPSSVTRMAARGKMPGAYTGGHWQGAANWQRHQGTPLRGFELGLAMKAPDANVGLVLGTVARPGLFVIGIDVDAEDPDTVDAIVRCLPASPMRKRGAKGETLFYAASDAIKSRSFDDHRIPREAGVPRRLVDLLTGFSTRQTCVPPSTHPDTGQPYVWLAGPVAAGDLPVFDEDALEVLIETLQQFGYDPEAANGGRGERKPYAPAEGYDTTGDAFDVAKRAALTNIGAWIHDVPGLHGLRPARGGFECVNTRRDSSSGQPLAKRKRNLSINPQGIVDFGTGESWSAIDFVSEFVGLTVSEALSWLEQRLELRDDSVVIDLQMPPPKAETAPSSPASGVEGAATSEKTGREEPTQTIPSTVHSETHGRRERVPARVLDLSAWTASRFVGTAPETKWLVRDAIPAAIPGMVAAQGDAGKSMLLLDLARRIAFNSSATEGPCFGGMVEQEGTCVVLTAEDDEPAIHRRIANLDSVNARHARNGERLIVVPLPDAGGPMPFVTMGRHGPEATEAYKRLADQLAAIPDLRLVVADPLQAFVLAPINEDPAAGQFICMQMATLAAETQATILLAHHMRKADRKTPVKTLQDIRDLVRGTSALVDGLRWAYGLVPEEEAAAREACRRLGVEFEPNRVIKGGVIKANGPVRRRMSTYIRNDVGLLVDQTSHLSEMPSEKQALVSALIHVVSFAAKTGAPFTRMGQTGFEQQKHRLPPILKEMGRDRLIRLADDALGRGLIVGTLAKGSTTAKWLDVPGGPFASGEGEFLLGATQNEAA